MAATHETYDDAMFAFSQGDFPRAAALLEALLEGEPEHFEARLALGMVYCRLGDLERALAEGHRAEQMRPHDQHVHTNLSLFYVKAGDKAKAEHHGVQARIASWRGNLAPPSEQAAADPDLAQARPAPAPPPAEFPDMPWKRKPPAAAP